MSTSTKSSKNTSKNSTSGFSLSNLSTLWADVCNLVIRPQRAQYEPQVALGPKLFTLGNRIFERTDLVIKNARNMKLQCSWYQPISSQRPSNKLPCVIYCHGNCGSRCDALDAVQVLLPYNITVLAFDFSGSGLSDGEYVSLGFFEKQDVAAIVEYLWKTQTVSRIGLWGRSMGAATSLMYAAEDCTIAGIVVDSPFASLEDLMMDLVLNYKSWIPKSMIKLGIKAMRRSIIGKAQFDIRKNSPISVVKNCFVPALFAHAEGDNFIKISHSERLYEAYSGDKNIIRFDGDHNSERPEFFFDSVSIFFFNTLISNDPHLTRDPKKKEPTEKEIIYSKIMKTEKEKDISKIKKQENDIIITFDSDDEEKLDCSIEKTALLDKNIGKLPSTPTSSRQMYLPKQFLEPTLSIEEQRQINQAMIESLKDQLNMCTDEKQEKELKAQLEEIMKEMKNLEKQINEEKVKLEKEHEEEDKLENVKLQF